MISCLVSLTLADDDYYCHSIISHFTQVKLKLPIIIIIIIIHCERTHSKQAHENTHNTVHATGLQVQTPLDGVAGHDSASNVTHDSLLSDCNQ